MQSREIDRLDPIEFRQRMAERNAYYAELLKCPLYADEAAALMPGLTEWHQYRALPPEEQVPPGLHGGDFANAYRDIPHPAGILDRKRGE